MAKSNDIKIEKTASLPTDLDYSKLPKPVLDAITTSQYTIEKESKLTWDGRQFIVRIPKEVALEAGIEEGLSMGDAMKTQVGRVKAIVGGKMHREKERHAAQGVRATPADFQFIIVSRVSPPSPNQRTK